MKNRILILLAMLLAVPYMADAQIATKVVYGQTQTLNNLPVSGIEISAKNSQATALSDSLGYFMIVCNDKDRLRFKSKVFNHKTVRINEKTPDSIFVNLNFVNSDRNVDVAIGYGYIKEKDRTQAVQYIKNRIDYSNYQSVYDILKNHFTNLQIHDDGCIIIRGPSSINGPNCAMYIVDGLKTDNIDHISPTDIKEISVLKDGSAAIYGVESGPGVIIINLKRGGD
ncbi:MAG: TonB-dependent receptor plug domain-containing protein [Bacteroidales bacterium]|nr:TonB-dependent receptor plug domain-containing protein [Bacteroidales bacterium]